METADRARRLFLKTIIPLLAILVFLRRYLTPGRGTPEKRLVVDRTDIPRGAALVYSESKVAVIRDDTDIYALDLTCTHLGCTVQVTPDGLTCPCHGSRFDRNGGVLQGPADRPLKRLQVRKRGGKLQVLA